MKSQLNQPIILLPHRLIGSSHAHAGRMSHPFPAARRTRGSVRLQGVSHGTEQQEWLGATGEDPTSLW